ncbi:MAG: putative quinol monooxygenase [Janthinobacterium lividum]
MATPKVTVLAELTVQPQYLGEVKALVAATARLNRTEPGCEAFFITTKHDDPNTLVLFEVFASVAAHEAHLATDYARHFFATVPALLAKEAVLTTLDQF